jgi:hypothetical protein
VLQQLSVRGDQRMLVLVRDECRAMASSSSRCDGVAAPSRARWNACRARASLRWARIREVTFMESLTYVAGGLWYDSIMAQLVHLNTQNGRDFAHAYAVRQPIAFRKRLRSVVRR